MRPVFFLMVLLLGCDAHRGYSLLDGGTIDLQSPTGKLVLINYWAVWCAPCRKEIPELNAFADRNSQQAIVLGVNFDGAQGDGLAEQVDRLGIQFPVLLEDPRALWAVERGEVLPETLVVGPDGKLLKRLVGPQTFEGLESLLAEFKQ